MLTPGDAAPWFEARSSIHPKSSFATRAGRYVVLCFFGSTSVPSSRQVLADVARQAGRFDGANVCFCGVSVDPADEADGRIPPAASPGVMHFWDADRRISELYGAIAPGGSQYLLHTLVLDPGLRVVATLPFEPDPAGHVARVLAVLDRLPPLASLTMFAPVLALPNVFEPEFCRRLIQLHQDSRAGEGGMLRDVDGTTVRVHDHAYKQRVDCNVTDPALLQHIDGALRRRVLPEIRKAFAADVPFVERHIVSCYDADAGGHFRPHRDNTTRGSAHRRFAVTINLNADEYAGGELRFPEFGVRTYRAATGGAIVFACALMHEVLPVTRGRRYAFLPFLYDEAGARLRDANLNHLAPELQTTGL